VYTVPILLLGGQTEVVYPQPGQGSGHWSTFSFVLPSRRNPFLFLPVDLCQTPVLFFFTLLFIQSFWTAPSLFQVSNDHCSAQLSDASSQMSSALFKLNLLFGERE
jgi:hypothetical protein